MIVIIIFKESVHILNLILNGLVHLVEIGIVKNRAYLPKTVHKEYVHGIGLGVYDTSMY